MLILIAFNAIAAGALAQQPVPADSARPGFVPPVLKGIAGEERPRTPRPVPFPAPDERWIRVITPRFDIVSSESERNTIPIAHDLESLAAALNDVQPRKRASSVPPTKVLIFGRRREAQPYFDLLLNRDKTDLTGLFVSMQDRGAMLIDGSRPYGTRTPYHELIHYLVASGEARPPLWLEEGIAEYYSSAEVHGNLISIGQALPEHMDLLRRRKMIPLADIFKVKYEEETASSHLFYAESWAAVDSLIRANRDAFPALIADVERGVDFETALRAKYNWTVRDLERAIAAHTVPERSMVIRVAVPPHDERTESQPLDRADVLFELGQLLSALDISLPEGERHLQAAVVANPNHARALMALGGLRMRAKKLDEAEPYFARAVAAAPTDGAVYLAYAEALLQDEIGQLAETAEIGAADAPRFRRARELAQQALAHGADRARSVGVIGISYEAEKDIRPGIAPLEEAHALLPSRVDYGLHLFALYRRTGDRTKADPLFAKLEASHNAQTVFAARAVMLRADLERANELVHQQKAAEAAALMREMETETPDQNARNELEKQAADLDRVARANSEINRYNEAVRLTNHGQRADAIQALDALLKDASDPDVIADAKKLRAQLLARKPR